jgi:tetratricopeptide (TPR) repeat protein
MPWWSRETDGHSTVDGSRPSARGGIHDLADRNARAAALFTSGNAKEAADLFEDTLRGCRALLGRDHYATLTVAGNLGVARVAAGRRREGIQLIAENVADRSRVLGEEDPRTLTALDALAVAYRLQGDVDDAVQLSGEVTAQRMRELGPAHPDTLTSRMGLARSQAAAGDLESAAALLSAAIHDAESLPPGHPHRTALVECAEAIGMTILAS